MSTLDRREEPGETVTTVEVKATGNVRRALGKHRFEFTFEGDTLGEFLDAFFAEYGCRELLIAETEADEVARGWARYEGTPPGRWVRNPEGERTRAYARVMVNGRTNELVDGFATRLTDGDRVALIHPFMFCC
jgi:molybdopterin converting factor small subunit